VIFVFSVPWEKFYLTGAQIFLPKYNNFAKTKSTASFFYENKLRKIRRERQNFEKKCPSFLLLAGT